MAIASSLTGRTLVLGSARLGNYMVLVISPIVLTRLLDVDTYGLYREFILYAMVFMGVSKFSIDRSLIYFIPKYPEREWVFVSQCIVFSVLFFLIGIGLFSAIYTMGGFADDFQFGNELLIYVFFLVQLDFVESYWLGRKDSFRVLLYSGIRMIARVGTVIWAAFVFGDAGSIVVGLIGVEALRWTLVLGYLLRQKLIGWRLERSTLVEQLRFFAPLGAANTVYTLNKYLGQIVTVVLLGPAALALYVLGAYLEMVSHLTRGSVSDVIFPDMVEAEQKTRHRSLDLWRTSTVIYAFLLVPLGCFFFIHAESVVTLLFSSTYAGATPVFMVFALLLIRDAINFGSPLRAMNRPAAVLRGTLLSLAVTVLATWPLVSQFGLVGPALAFLAGRIAEEIYMGRQLLGITGLSLRDVLPWRQLGCLLLLAVVAVGGSWLVTLPLQEGIGRTLLAAVLGAASYLALVRYQRFAEIESLMNRLIALVRRRLAGAAA